MPGVADPRRAPMVLAHHKKAPSDEFLWEVMRGLCPPQWTEAGLRDQLEKVRKSGYLLPLGFFYPPPFGPSDTIPVQVSYLVNPSGKFQVSGGRRYESRELQQHGKEWLQVTGNAKDMDYAQVPDAAWFLDKAQKALAFFEPDFAAGHLDTILAPKIDEGLDTFAWPIMLFGPERVAAFGEIALLAAPVWKAERLPNGGVWLQLEENPFYPEKDALRALADHLSLKTPLK